MPAIGVVLCSALLVADFGKDRRLRGDQQHVDMLAQTAPHYADVAANALDPSRPEDADKADFREAPFEGRAAALLNIACHRTLTSPS